MIVVSEVVLAFLKSAVKFLWEYKAWVVVGALIASTFYYKEMLEFEKGQHDKTILEYKKKLSDQQADWLVQITEIQNTALSNYSALQSAMNDLQEKSNERNKSIDKLSGDLNSLSNGLSNEIERATSNISSSNSSGDSEYAESLRKLGRLSTECQAEVTRLATTASREQEAKVTLQEAWKEVQDKYNNPTDKYNN